MAGKAMDIIGFYPHHGATKVALYHGGTYDYNYHLLDRNTLVVLVGKLGYKLTKSPLKYSKNELVAIVRDNFIDNTKPESEMVSFRSTGSTPIPTPKPASESKPTATTAVVDGAFRTMIQTILQDMGSDGIDEQRVQAIVNEAIGSRLTDMHSDIQSVRAEVVANVREISNQVRSALPTVVNVTLSGGNTRKVEGRVHFMFEKVMRVVDQGLSPWLTGGAGVGKTTIAEQVAHALDLDYSPESFCSQSSKAEMKGYKTANGLYESTEFRKRFEQGGVYLLDEVDAANPNILLSLNSALSNGVMAFPDGVVRKHPKFVAIACANTYGNGATAEYVGRQVIDGSSVDRFVKLDIPVDEDMEGGIVADLSVDRAAGMMWHTVVRAARQNVEKFGLKVIVSPRASYHGAKLLNAGFTFAECVPMTFGSGMKREQFDKVMDNIAIPVGGAVIPS